MDWVLGKGGGRIIAGLGGGLTFKWIINLFGVFGVVVTLVLV